MKIKNTKRIENIKNSLNDLKFMKKKNTPSVFFFPHF